MDLSAQIDVSLFISQLNGPKFEKLTNLIMVNDFLGKEMGKQSTDANFQFDFWRQLFPLPTSMAFYGDDP